MQNQPPKISFLGKRSQKAPQKDLSKRQETSQSPQEEVPYVRDDQSDEIIQNGYMSTESDSERPKKKAEKKRHEKYLKDQRLVDIDEKIDTPDKLRVFVRKILKHAKLLQTIKVSKGYQNFEMARLIFARERLYDQISKMDLRRYKKINGQKTQVKEYLRQLSDDEIWIVLADAIEINNEFLKTRPKMKVVKAMEEIAMENPKYRQFQDHQRIPQDLLQVLKKESGSILLLMNKLTEVGFFQTLKFESESKLIRDEMNQGQIAQQSIHNNQISEGNMWETEQMPLQRGDIDVVSIVDFLNLEENFDDCESYHSLPQTQRCQSNLQITQNNSFFYPSYCEYEDSECELRWLQEGPKPYEM